MRYDVFAIFKSDERSVLKNKFSVENLLKHFGKPLDIKKIKKLIIYRYDYLEVAYMGDQFHYLMLDDLNYKYETENALIFEMVEPLLNVKLPLFKLLLDENKISYDLSVKNTFSDQVCLETKSGWLIYFNKIDEIIRSAIYSSVSTNMTQ